MVAPLADVGLFAGDAAAVVEAAAAFAGHALVFAVEGGGATVDATGRVTVPATAARQRDGDGDGDELGRQRAVSFVATVSVRIVPPILVLAPVLAGTGRIGEPVTVSAGSWSGVPAPTTRVAWLRDGTAIAGAAGTSYTPVAADDGKGLSARVTATNAGGSAETVTAALAVTYAPPVAKGGLEEEIFDLGSGVQTVAAGADFTGEALRFAVSGAGATIDATTGLVSIPTDSAVQATVTVTATNSGGSATSSFGVTVEAEDVPFALEADDVEIVDLGLAARGPGGLVHAGRALPRPRRRDGGRDRVDDEHQGVDPGEPSTRSSPGSARTATELYMRDPAKNAPGASPRVDYSVFRLTETARREALRFRWRRTAEGPWSALSPAFAVPAVPAPASGWLPLVARNKDEFEAGAVGGPGYQFLRSFATTPAAPNLVVAAMDQNFPWQSDDFGASFFTPEWNGMWVGRSGVSAWIDPENAGRQLMLYSTASQYFDTAYDAYSGAYLSTDGGKTATRVLSLPLLTGTQSVRHNLQLIAHAPGGTPETRTIYLMQVSHTSSNSTAETIQLWRSTDGGATWAKRGSALPVATYAGGGASAVWGIAVAPNGDLYQWGTRGAWRSPAGADVGLTWSRLDTLPSGKAVHEMDASAGNGVVWAIVGDNGLYKATNGVSFAKNTALGTKDPRTFGISPADRNYIVVQCVGQQAPSWSQDGGATWAVGTTRMALGQDDDFSHKFGSGDHYGIVPKLDDRNTWLAWRNMHLGISRDGGRSWDWTGARYDGTDTRGMGFHPTDWKVFAQAQQDRSVVLTQTAGDYWLNDGIDKGNTHGVAITTAVGDNQYISGGAAIIHASGRMVTLQGHVSSGRVPVIHQAAGNDPLGETLVKGDYLSRISEYYGSLDPRDGDTGFLGRYRVGNLGAAAMSAVSFTQMAHHFVGATGAGGTTVIYGADKTKGDRTIYRSTDRGTSWTTWHVAAAPFRPVDDSPVARGLPARPRARLRGQRRREGGARRGGLGPGRDPRLRRADLPRPRAAEVCRQLDRGRSVRSEPALRLAVHVGRPERLPLHRPGRDLGGRLDRRAEPRRRALRPSVDVGRLLRREPRHPCPAASGRAPGDLRHRELGL